MADGEEVKGRVERANDGFSLEAETTRFLKRASQSTEEYRAKVRAGRKRRADQAKALAEAVLTEDQVKARMGITGEDVEVLKGILHRPGRNAVAQLGAFRTLAEFTLAKPKQAFEGDVGVQVIVNTMKKAEYVIPANSTATGALDGNVPVATDVGSGSLSGRE